MAKDFPIGKIMPLRSIPGAMAVREKIYVPGDTVPEHSHDRIGVTIPLVGEFTAISDAGEAVMRGAAAVLHPPGSPHAALISGNGLETVGFQLDPRWLRRIGLTGPF